MKIIKHALLVDDDAVINMINTRIIQLSKLAVNIKSVTGGREALVELTKLAGADQNEFPEIIFLDINMPDMDGWEFLNEFIKFPAHILEKCKVVMLTSSIDLFDIKKARTYSIVSDYIIKPLNVKLLNMLGSPKHRYFTVCQSAVQGI